MAKYPVLKGAEPFFFEGGETGVLVSHGFTGTTQYPFHVILMDEDGLIFAGLSNLHPSNLQ